MKLSHSTVLALLIIAACSRPEDRGLALEGKLPGHFGSISNVVELRDGRVVFADTRNKLFLRGDLKSQKIDTLGKRVVSLSPTGPADEYKFPGWVAHLAGDTVALVDFSAIRTTLWNESGRSLGVLPLVNVAGNTPILLYDTLGHGYKIDYQAVIGGGDPGRSLRPDSIPVLRFTVQDGMVDTIALLSAPEYGDAMFGEQVQQAAKVFAPNDFFGVLPDGTGWVARGRANRVDWLSAEGHWSRGQTHKYTPVPVTQADKDRVLAQVREHGQQFGMPQNLPISYPFAETKAPFELALGRPTGEVWLQRPRSRDDAAVTYDVFNRQGVWVREVTFPQGATLAGFGWSGSIYASMKNDDGTRTVGRFRLE